MIPKDINKQTIPEYFCTIIELVSERLSKLPKVLSLMVYGSVAHGWADDFSDVCFSMVCENIPPESDRRLAYAGFGPPIYLSQGLVENTSCWDQLDIHQKDGKTIVNIFIEIYNQTSQLIERIINMENATENDWHRASSLQDGIIVIDHGEVLSYLRDKIQPMPNEIRRFLVIKALTKMIEHTERAKKGAFRNDFFLVHQQLLNLVRSIAHVCLHFNGRYYSGDTNLQRYLLYCSVLPDKCIQRLIEIITDPNPIYAFQKWYSLAQEAMHLISEDREMKINSEHWLFKDMERLGEWKWRHW